MLNNQDYQDLIQAVQNMLIKHRTSLKDLANPGIGPQLEGLTRMLGWEKGVKHLYNWQRAKINTGTLTQESENLINRTLGNMQSLQLFSGIYENCSQIRCNPPQKIQEHMIVMQQRTKTMMFNQDAPSVHSDRQTQ